MKDKYKSLLQYIAELTNVVVDINQDKSIRLKAEQEVDKLFEYYKDDPTCIELAIKFAVNSIKTGTGVEYIELCMVCFKELYPIKKCLCAEIEDILAMEKI